MRHSDGELLALVRTYVATVLGVEVRDIDAGTDLRSVGLDSLELLDIGAALERDLSIRIQPDDFAKADTVAHVVALLRQQQPSDSGGR